MKTIKVKVRMKQISGNRKSLFLDFYPPIQNPETGKQTRREFLQLSILDETEYEQKTITNKNGKPQVEFIPILGRDGKPKKIKLNPIEKERNRETLALAESICAKRQFEIQSGQYGFLSDTKTNADFVQYFKMIADKRKISMYDNWTSTQKFLEKFTGGKLRFADVNENFCNDFKEYLLNAYGNRSGTVKLSQNTAALYLSKLKTVLKEAHRDGYLQTDLNAKLKAIKATETHREYLTHEELQKLASTDCPLTDVYRRAALFSALTGLRFSDIKKMVWGEVRHSNKEGYSLQFTQQKTRGTEVLPISEQAYSLLGKEDKASESVFKGLSSSAYSNILLKKWLLKAEITKNITFHCFRHTFATLQLSKGTDIYTVSKMLGHRELKTTQVYAKIIDKTKREASDKIKLDL